MRSIIRRAALTAVACVALGAAAAQAGSQVGIVLGPPVPYSFPSPEYIPAPLPPPTASMPGMAVPPAPAAQLPPVVLYAPAPVAVPLASSGRR